MNEIKRFQVRGVAGDVRRFDFDGRIIDYWQPSGPVSHLLIAHDGQNVFDARTSTHRGQTWKMAQSAIRVSQDLRINPPAIIAIWHSSTKANPWGRGKDLVPEKYFREGIPVQAEFANTFDPTLLHGDNYLEKIFSTYIPALAPTIAAENTAMIGSSMGALATLYALAEHSNRFTTALALSPHWPFGADALVERTIGALPEPSGYKVWMSHGTKGLDSEYGPYQLKANALMHEHGFGSHNFISKIYNRSAHNERSWAKYLDQPMRFWLESN